MLNEVADGVWVRQSEWVWSNSTVLRAGAGVVLVDPGINGAELAALADDVERLGLPVLAGFATHPHWDHLLWHPRFGDVPRYATAAAAALVAPAEIRERGRGMAAESASEVPLELLGLVTALPPDGGPLPGEVIEHQGHAVGHAALWLADRKVLLAGDLFSDELVPMADGRSADPWGTYAAALDRLAEVTREAEVLVPGHGSVARGAEVSARVATDRAYVAAVRRGEQPEDGRFGPRG